ncbi:MAG: hypothetical protein NXH70_08805 [Hyphomonas sp.]|nr:hypothetical protein [Hyphomonas sp.]
MRMLLASSAAALISQSLSSAAEKTAIVPTEFVGNWSCVYEAASDPSKYAPRSKVWRIYPTGDAETTGIYPADHSTGIEGRYVSKQRLTFETSAFVQELIDYVMIDPIRDGVPMTTTETDDFERIVMSGPPIRVAFEWLNTNSFRALSAYTNTRCERMTEAGS